MNKTSGQQILQFQKIYYVPLFFFATENISDTQLCYINFCLLLLRKS